MDAKRVFAQQSTVRYVRYIDDFPAYSLTNVWTDIGGAPNRVYVVQTNSKIVSRCLLMTTNRAIWCSTQLADQERRLFLLKRTDAGGSRATPQGWR